MRKIILFGLLKSRGGVIARIDADQENLLEAGFQYGIKLAIHMEDLKFKEMMKKFKLGR
jgi:hypothetical protein